MRDLQAIVQLAEQDTRKSVLPIQAITSRLRHVLETTSRQAFYTDPTYLPFYRYLSRRLQPKRLFDASLNGGLLVGAMLLGEVNVERVFGCQNSGQSAGISASMALRNIRNVYRGICDIYVGSILDDHVQSVLQEVENGWDAMIISGQMSYDDMLAYLRFMWRFLSDDGVIIMDRVNYDKSAGRAYKDFCKSVAREPCVARSKYGTGLIAK